MMLSSHLTCPTICPRPVSATGTPDDDVATFFRTAMGKIGLNHPRPIFAAGQRRKKKQAAKAIRLRLAQLRYGLLVLAFSAAAWFLTCLLLHVMGNIALK